MVEKTPAKITEAQRILDLARKSRPGPAAGPAGTPQTPPGKPSTKS